MYILHITIRTIYIYTFIDILFKYSITSSFLENDFSLKLTIVRLFY